MSADALWLFDGYLIIGNQRVVAKAETAAGLGATLTRAFARQPTQHQVDLFRTAAQRSRQGDNAVANMQRAIAGASRVHELQAQEIRGTEGDPLSKYPGQPRISAGNGRESGWWTSGQEAATGEDHTTPPPTQIIPATTCREYIAENCQGKILREFPSQFLGMSLEELLVATQGGDAAARKAKNLLFDKRFQKP